MIREFSEIAQEYFDLMDESTLHCLTTINEADQYRTMDGLTVQLYKMIQADAMNVDFDSIAESRGDITKVDGYEDMITCVGIIKNILVEYRQDTAPVNEIFQAISNVQERQDLWVKGYQMKVDLAVLLYQSQVLSIFTSISLLIDGCIEYIKDASDECYAIKLDKVAYAKKKDGLIFKNLKSFNKACDSGDIDKALEYVFTGKTHPNKLIGMGGTATLIAIAGIASLVHVIIPLLRECIYFFYLAKVRISDACDIQAQLIEMNAEALKNNEYSKLSGKEKTEAIKRQKSIADKFRRFGSKFTVKAATGERDTKRAMEIDKKKYTINDVIDDKLDSYDDSQSSLF